jgi:hypothetical protein
VKIVMGLAGAAAAALVMSACGGSSGGHASPAASVGTVAYPRAQDLLTAMVLAGVICLDVAGTVPTPSPDAASWPTALLTSPATRLSASSRHMLRPSRARRD